MRLRFAEGVAGQHKFRRGNRDTHNARAFERGSEQPRAEAFAEGGEAVHEFGRAFSCRDHFWLRHFVEKVAAEGIQVVGDAIVFVRVERQITENIEVLAQDGLRFVAGPLAFLRRDRLRDEKEPVGDAFHGGDDDNDLHELTDGADELGGMQHPLRAEQRAAAELEDHQGFATHGRGIRVAGFDEHAALH